MPCDYADAIRHAADADFAIRYTLMVSSLFRH